MGIILGSDLRRLRSKQERGWACARLAELYVELWKWERFHTKSIGMTFVCSAKEILENTGMMDYRPPVNSCR